MLNAQKAILSPFAACLGSSFSNNELSALKANLIKIIGMLLATDMENVCMRACCGRGRRLHYVSVLRARACVRVCFCLRVGGGGIQNFCCRFALLFRKIAKLWICSNPSVVVVVVVVKYSNMS